MFWILVKKLFLNVFNIICILIFYNNNNFEEIRNFFILGYFLVGFGKNVERILKFLMY